MAIVEINGRQVEVDDAFLGMSAEEQAAEIDFIASQIPAAPPSAATPSPTTLAVPGSVVPQPTAPTPPEGVVDSVANALSRRRRDFQIGVNTAVAENELAGQRAIQGDAGDIASNIIFGNGGLQSDADLIINPGAVFLRGLRALSAGTLVPGGEEGARERASTAVQRIGELSEERAQFPLSESGGRAVQDLSEAQTFGEGLETILSRPGAVATGAAEIAAEQIPDLAATALVPGGPLVRAATLGTNSGLRERFGQVVQLAQEQGLDLQDPEVARRIVDDPEGFLAEARRRGEARGSVIGGVEAISGGVASRVLSASPAANFLAQTSVQTAAGAAGEAGAQLASEGEITSPGEVLLEGLAEGIAAPAEVFGTIRQYAQSKGEGAAPTVQDAVLDAENGDATAQEVLSALELTPEQVAEIDPQFRERAAGRVQARREEDAAAAPVLPEQIVLPPEPDAQTETAVAQEILQNDEQAVGERSGLGRGSGGGQVAVDTPQIFAPDTGVETTPEDAGLETETISEDPAVARLEQRRAARAERFEQPVLLENRIADRYQNRIAEVRQQTIENDALYERAQRTLGEISNRAESLGGNLRNFGQPVSPEIEALRRRTNQLSNRVEAWLASRGGQREAERLDSFLTEVQEDLVSQVRADVAPVDVPRRRVIDAIVSAGGIRRQNADGSPTAAAAELAARDIRPGGRGVPRGLFNSDPNAGVGLDTLPIDEAPELTAVLDQAPDGTYFDPDAVVDAIASEAAGSPTLTAEESEATVAADTAEAEYRKHLESLEFNPDAEPDTQTPPGLGSVPFSNPMFNPEVWSWYGRWIGQLTNRMRTKLKGSTTASDPDVLKRNRRRPIDVAADAANWGFSTYDGRLRALNRRHKSKTLTKLLDQLWSRSGAETTNSGSGLEERISRHVHSSLARAGQIAQGLDDDALLKVTRAVRSGRTRDLSGQERTASEQLRRWFRDQLSYLRDAGVNIGEVRENFFPREFDIDLVRDNQEKFIENAAGLYQENDSSISAEDATAQARALVDELVTEGSIHFYDNRGGGTSGSIFKGRVFGPKADLPLAEGGLQEFMIEDFRYALSRYVTRAAKRAEIARVFGDQAANWESQFVEPMREEGVPLETIELVRDYVHDLAGLRHHSGGMGQRILSWAHTILTMSFLEFATLTSIPEVVTPALRTGDMGDAMTLLGQAAHDLSRTVLGLNPRDQQRAARELAEDIGSVAADSTMSFQLARFLGTDQVNRRQAELLGAYFKTIGLHQFTDYTRVQATSIGVKFLRRVSKALKGESFLMTPKAAGEALSEFGLTGADAEAFADYVLEISPEGGIPSPEALSGPQGEKFKAALFRMTDQSIMRPNAATKPSWATSSVFGRVIFALQSFGYAFTKNVLARQFRNAKKTASSAGKALTTGDIDAARDAATHMIPVLMTATLLPIAQLILGVGRDELDEVLSGQETREKTDLATLERAVSRSGLTGALDPYIQLVSGTRYNRTALQGLAGPVIGTVGDVATTAAAVAVNNSEDTNSTERRLFDQIWQTGVEGGTAAMVGALPHPFLGWVALAGVRGSRERVGEAVLPVRPNRRDVQPQRSFLEGRRPPPLTPEQQARLDVERLLWDMRNMDLIVQRQIAKELREIGE